jgi:peptidoglycan/xylan/chitin deacetylase (PgdA/CDA1 family)
MIAISFSHFKRYFSISCCFVFISSTFVAGCSFSPPHGSAKNFTIDQGGIIRGDTTQKEIALVFTGHKFADGGDYIANFLQANHLHASFFLTGHFYRKYPDIIKKLQNGGNYLGSHSNSHPLYASWEKRDSLLITKEEFMQDLDSAYAEMSKFGINKRNAHYFLPAYEYYNDSISKWTEEAGLRLVNFTPGTYSNADYTYPELGEKYLSSDTIFHRILAYERKDPHGLNGFLLLTHIGTDSRRKDKFYKKLPALTDTLQKLGYKFVRIDELLGTR